MSAAKNSTNNKLDSPTRDDADITGPFRDDATVTGVAGPPTAELAKTISAASTPVSVSSSAAINAGVVPDHVGVAAVAALPKRNSKEFRARKFSSIENVEPNARKRFAEDSRPCTAPAITSPSLALKERPVSAVKRQAAVPTQPPKPLSDVLPDLLPNLLTINVQPFTGDSFGFEFMSDCNVFDLKDSIYQRTGIPYEKQLLTLASTGDLLADDDAFFDEVGLGHNSTVRLAFKASCGIEAPTYSNSYDDAYLLYEVYLPVDEHAASTPHYSSPVERSKEQDVLLKPIADCDDPSKAALPSFKELFRDRRRTPDLILDEQGLSSLFSGRTLTGPPEDLDALRIAFSDEDFMLSSGLQSLEVPMRPSTPAPFTADSAIVEETPRPLSTHCDKCRLKLKLTQRYPCKCGMTFCPSHRFFDQHGCAFDYRTNQRIVVEKANPKVLKPKVDPV